MAVRIETPQRVLRPRKRVIVAPDAVGKKPKRAPVSKPVKLKSESELVKAVKEEIEVKEDWQEPDIEDVSEIVAPKGWTDIVEKIRIMRAARPAPVDSMGCAVTKDNLKDAKTQRVHILIALMLSAQTKDEITAAAHLRLRENLPGKELTVASVLASNAEDIAKLIYPVGFYTRKAQFLIKTCEILHRDYDDDVPLNVEDMLKLPGVGPKMAHLLRQGAWGIADGIGVDVHVHRLAQMWNWVPANNNPEKTRIALEKWLPKELWSEINPLLVGFGQTYCPSRGSRCEECSLTTEECPSRKLAAKKKKKVTLN